MTRGFSESHKIDPSDFPHLAEFTRGYLHQDLAVEHGSASEAAKAYLRDLDFPRRKQVAKEASRLRQIAQDWTVEELNAALAHLGGYWLAPSRAEFFQLMEAFQG